MVASFRRDFKFRRDFRRDFPNGQSAYVMPLTFGRGRICVGDTAWIQLFHEHGY